MHAVLTALGCGKMRLGQGKIGFGVLDPLRIVGQPQALSMGLSGGLTRQRKGHVAVLFRQISLLIFAVGGFADEQIGVLSGVNQRIAGGGIPGKNKFQSRPVGAHDLLRQYRLIV